MRADTLHLLIRRDLGSLRREVEAYPTEDALWIAPPGVPNSAGVLVRHLCGNLRHYFGAVMGQTGYVRERPLEFAAPPVSRAALLALIDATEAEVLPVLASLRDEQLTGVFPEPQGGRTFGMADYLTHLVMHLGYHLGQIDYHRRLLTTSTEGGLALNSAALPDR
jgi:uncharacterized damage-inducible protein DinB